MSFSSDMCEKIREIERDIYTIDVLTMHGYSIQLISLEGRMILKSTKELDKQIMNRLACVRKELLEKLKSTKQERKELLNDSTF